MDKELLIKLQKEKSHKMLADADEMVIQKRWDIAANRYYYACYHMLQALFISRGVSAKSHDGSLTHLGQDFILSGEVDKKFGRFFSRMVQLRHKADYPQTQFYTSHCTGNHVFELMQTIMPTQLHPFTCGTKE